MSGEEKTHTQGEVDIIKSITRVETLQCMQNDDFRDHKKEDSEHFDNLYDADKEILSEVRKIPERMFQCREELKAEILEVSETKFVTSIDMEKHKGDVKETVAEVKGSLKTTFIVMGIFQSVLLIFLAAWLKSNGV